MRSCPIIVVGKYLLSDEVKGGGYQRSSFAEDLASGSPDWFVVCTHKIYSSIYSELKSKNGKRGDISSHGVGFRLLMAFSTLTLVS